MQILVLILAVIATVLAPYALVMAVPRLSHAIIVAIAVAVPITLALHDAELPGFNPADWIYGIDVPLLSASLAAIAVAVFVRVVVASLGERARRPSAIVTINVLGIALVAGTLPWWSELIARVPHR